MNLKEFITYRNNCPICNDKLSTFFHSEKQQSFKYEEDRMVVIFRMDGLKKHQINYKVGYSFGPEDNSWQVEFYNQDGIRFEKDSPYHLMDKFRELNKNLGLYKFYRVCTAPKCHRYNYSTNQFSLKYKRHNIGDLSIKTEYIGMTMPTENGYKIFKLLNEYASPSRSTVVYGKHKEESIARDDWGMHNPPLDNLDILQTHIIKFSSKEETMERINKLIIFS